MDTAQDIIKGPSDVSFAGFNRRISGETSCNGIIGRMYAGWTLADDMIRKGKLFSVHNFHHSHGDCSGFAFQSGGTWVCNTCNRSHLDRPWWVIKVLKDGNAWCCIGEGFENLQESENYAFGDTREEAIKNYGDLMGATV